MAWNQNQSCKGCVPPERTITCKFDGTCDKYRIGKEKNEAIRHERLESKKAEEEVLDLLATHGTRRSSQSTVSSRVNGGR